MFDGIYGYFFGSEDAQSTAAGNNGNNQNEWIFVEQASGRSSPVMVADFEMQELKDEDVNSTVGDKQNNEQQTNRKVLRKMRKEVSNQAKKQQVKELLHRRKEIEKTLFGDSSGADSSSTSSSPITPAPISSKHLMDGMKSVVGQRKKKCGIKQPKGGKGDNRN